MGVVNLCLGVVVGVLVEERTPFVLIERWTSFPGSHSPRKGLVALKKIPSSRSLRIRSRSLE